MVGEKGNEVLISVMIPVYNCAHLLKEALMSVLSQDLGPELMEITVVDDHSLRDDPKAIVDEIGCGRISFFRQQENVGQMYNLNTCIELSKGELVHILHCDDRVLPGFYKNVIDAFDAMPGIGAVFTRNAFINEQGSCTNISSALNDTNGIIENWLQKIYTEQLIQTPAIVVKKSVYRQIGFFRTDLKTCEDWEMWVRISEKFPVWYINKVLAEYRITTGSTTSKNNVNGRFVQDLKTLQAFFYSKHKSKKILLLSNFLYSNSLLNMCITYIADKSIRLAQIRKLLLSTIGFPISIMQRLKIIVVLFIHLSRRSLVKTA